MIQPAVVAALGAVLGGLVAVSARDGRILVAGLVLAMVAAPIAATPEPTTLAIAFRIVGASLAGYLLWVSSRSREVYSEGSGIGLPAEMAIAAAAFAVGWLVAPVKPLVGPLAAQAAGISLVALAMGPLAGRDVLRVGTALAVLALGITLLLQAWVPPASALEAIVLTAVVVGIVGATSLLIAPYPREAESPAGGDLTAEAAGELDAAETAVVASEPTLARDEPQDEVAPVPAPAGAGRTPAPARVMRTSSPRALRQAAPRGTPRLGPDAGETPGAPSAQPSAVPPANPVRRLRPREPRR